MIGSKFVAKALAIDGVDVSQVLPEKRIYNLTTEEQLTAIT
jgi:hypothetical protein